MDEQFKLTEQIRDLEERVKWFEDYFKRYAFNSKFTMARDMEITSSFTTKNLYSKEISEIGDKDTSLIGMYGVTPIVQQPLINTPSGGSPVDSQARTAINSIITTLRNIGITL